MTRVDVRGTADPPPGTRNNEADEIRQALRDVRGLSLLDGVFVAGTFSVGTKTVTHTLGRAPAHVIVTKKPASTLGYYTDEHKAKSMDVTVAAAGDWEFWIF